MSHWSQIQYPNPACHCRRRYGDSASDRHGDGAPAAAAPRRQSESRRRPPCCRKVMPVIGPPRSKSAQCGKKLKSAQCGKSDSWGKYADIHIISASNSVLSPGSPGLSDSDCYTVNYGRILKWQELPVFSACASDHHKILSKSAFINTIISPTKSPEYGCQKRGMVLLCKFELNRFGFWLLFVLVPEYTNQAFVPNSNICNLMHCMSLRVQAVT